MAIFTLEIDKPTRTSNHWKTQTYLVNSNVYVLVCHHYKHDRSSSLYALIVISEMKLLISVQILHKKKALKH